MPVTSLHRRFSSRAGGLLLCTFLVLAACSTNKISPATLDLQAELEARELQLQKRQAELEKRTERLEKRATRVQLKNKENRSESARLSEKQRSLKQQLIAAEQSNNNSSTDKSSSPAEKAVSSMLLLGATERVVVHPPNVKLTGRSDTGAKRCMLGVYDLAEFERDGEPHVRFSIVPEKDAKKVEVTRPIKSHVRFAELNSSNKKRPVVLLRLALGSIDEQVEVVLVENNKAEASGLSVGRNLLRDLAVVDVSKNMLIKQKAE